jgi:hypothetical protein
MDRASLPLVATATASATADDAASMWGLAVRWVALADLALLALIVLY